MDGENDSRGYCRNLIFINYSHCLKRLFEACAFSVLCDVTWVVKRAIVGIFFFINYSHYLENLFEAYTLNPT